LKKTSPVFVATNRVERLPGEFLRKGRDEIFFVDLPNAERKEIFTFTSSSVNEILLALISIN